jgi:SCF-associated factor 1
MKLTADIPPIQRLLAGRRHVLAVDEHGKIWTWANWAEIGRLRVPWLNSRLWRIVDLTAGWDVSAVLTEFTKKDNNNNRGRQAVRVWWQRFLAPSLRTVDTLGAPGPDRVSGSNACFHFTPSQVVTLPELPPAETDDDNEQQRIVKLAAGEEFLIALTESGRIYKMDLSFPPVVHQPGQPAEDEPSVDDGTIPPRRFADFEALFQSGRRNWEYMENFSSNFDTQDKIHHISASFRTFFAIGNGKVLQGNREMTGFSEPIIMPSLQNKGVIRYAANPTYLMVGSGGRTD